MMSEATRQQRVHTHGAVSWLGHGQACGVSPGGEPSTSTIMETRDRAAPTATRPDEQRIRGFGQALDALRTEVESDLGARDAAHIERICGVSRQLELVGRVLLHFSFEPIGFSAATLALGVHKSLELMEIGHMALHGAYDAVSPDPRLHSNHFRWKAPIDEAGWKVVHNLRHHQYTNIAGRDPDLNFGFLRLSPYVAYRKLQRLQPLSNVVTWFGFASAINWNVNRSIGSVCQAHPHHGRADGREGNAVEPRRSGHSKARRYYAKEFIVYPMLAGPFAWKVLLGNALAEMGRDVCAGAIIYCGHVGTTHHRAGTKAGSRARWYAMQVESARDVELSAPLSILCGALDKQIEHHLFPRLPPNRLREIAPRVRQICDEFGVHYRTARWPETLGDVLRQLRTLGRSSGSLPQG